MAVFEPQNNHLIYNAGENLYENLKVITKWLWEMAGGKFCCPILMLSSALPLKETDGFPVKAQIKALISLNNE